MKKNKLLALILSVVMVAGILTTGFTVSAQQEGAVLSAFKNPGYTAKPMARMWFPDAGAGIDEYDTVEKQINALAAWK